MKQREIIKCIDGDDLRVYWDASELDNQEIVVSVGYADLDLADIATLRKALDKAEAAYLARTAEPIFGLNDSACEPSSRDRLFYQPQSFTMPNGETRHFSPPPPFEPCSGVDLRGKVVNATHPEPPQHVELSSDKIVSIAAEMKRLAMMPKVGAIEPMPEHWFNKPLLMLGGLTPISKPHQSQLTDWVRAQPEGAKLLAVFRDGEPIPAVSTYDNHGKQLHECYEYALYARMVGGYGYSAVWLSREVAPDCENRIPQGISVYREGTS